MKKTETKTTKKVVKNVKTTKPVIELDLVGADSMPDVLNRVIIAKIKAGVPITQSEYKELINSAIDFSIAFAANMVEFINNAIKTATATPKKPWYKRFWSWITGKKN